MDNDAKLISFWELIEKTQVVIPIIQRDYAQGRTDPKSTAIRDRFLKDIKDTLINNEAELKLDFIYGQVSHDGVFEPLDGQQRLTTLFLLHWYLAVKDGLTDECQKLSNFSYHTRESARLFCERLVQWPYDPSADNRAPSVQIKDQTWFVHAWLQDPTVCAMLVMLDAIHATFKNTETEFKHLHRIKFYKLDMQGYGATDDLYIKMNARGKPLTNFENLKASLSQFLYTEDSGDLAEELMENIDNKWSKELFWKYKHDMTFDDFAYNLFRLIFICEALLKLDSNNGDTAKTIIDAYLYTDMLKQKMISVDVIRELQNAINGLSNTSKPPSVLQILVDYDIRHFYGHSSDFKDLVNQTKISYAQILRFFVIYKIAARNDDQELMYQKLRIARNLINDVAEYNLNSASDLINALCSLNTFINECDSLNSDKILSEFSESPFQEIVLKEEKQKLSLIYEDENWKNPIYKAENHPYFKGQIGMILALARNENTYNIRVFEHYYKILGMMFNEDGLNQEITGQEFLIERALLAFGESGEINEQYLLPEGYNHSFLEANGRDTSWKRLMRGDRKEQYELFIKFINCNFSYGKFDPSIDNLKRKLDEIIDDFLADQCNQQDWRYYMIKFPDIIARCKKRYIRWIDSHHILLLGARQTNGYHDEYYSYAQYLTWKESDPTYHPSYHCSNSIDDWKYIEISGYNIAYDHDIGEFVKINDPEVDEYEEFDPAEYKTFQLYGGFIPTPSKP